MRAAINFRANWAEMDAGMDASGFRKRDRRHRKTWTFRPLQAREALLYGRVANPRARSFLGSSVVEHSTVNRMVADSNPARGARRPFPPPSVLVRRRLITSTT